MKAVKFWFAIAAIAAVAGIIAGGFMYYFAWQYAGWNGVWCLFSGTSMLSTLCGGGAWFYANLTDSQKPWVRFYRDVNPWIFFALYVGMGWLFFITAAGIPILAPVVREAAIAIAFAASWFLAILKIRVFPEN